MANIQTLRAELETELRINILPFWMNRMPDDLNGGFYGAISGRGEQVTHAPKGAVMHARILWTFSAAYRIFGQEQYRHTATAAKNYLLSHFYDQLYGGIYWSLNTDGTPLDMKKQTYAIGFAIYGLSEYHRATGDVESLEYAVRLFHDIEQHTYDHEYGGYFEASLRDWTPIEDMRLSDKDANEKKSMNTHLHILEPYTNLYRVWKDEKLKSRLIDLINIFTDRIESPLDHHLRLFFDEQWNDKSDGVYSYGHDIEASWLLAEAAMEIGEESLINSVKEHSAMIAEAAMEGYGDDGGMAYERLHDGSVDTERHWWVQAETVVGLYYLHRWHDSEKALALAVKTWEYIKNHIIDSNNGEWLWSIRADGTANYDDDKAGFWKCPYHNGRMCMEIISSIDESMKV